MHMYTCACVYMCNITLIGSKGVDEKKNKKWIS